MKPFRERNPVRVGLVGASVMTVVGLIVFFWQDLPVISGNTGYTAQFSEAAGLRDGDEVRVAGVKVGEVTDVRLAGDHVDVDFRVRGVWIGDRTRVGIKIKTLLGAKNLAVDPLGSAEQDPGTPIGRDRTVTPYDVNDAFSDLAKTTGQIDTAALAESFRVLTDTFRASTPENFRGALDGVAALSTTIASRDGELRKLLVNTSKITKTAADRNTQFELLITDAGTLLAEFRGRRDVIHQLLAGSRELAEQLSGLVADNSAQLGPALAELDRVTDVLARNQDKLDRSLSLAGPFYRLVGEAVSNGPWIDTYLCGLVTGPSCTPPKPGGGR